MIGLRDRESGRIELHPAELFLLWHALGLGELPAILGVPHLGYRERERAEMVVAASAALTERGLGTVNQPTSDLEGALRTVADAELLLDLHAEDADRSLRAVGASGNREAVVLGVSGETAWLTGVRPTGLVAGLVDVLEPASAPLGRTANVRVSDYEAACRAGERGGSTEFAARLRDAGLRPPEVNTLARAVSQRTGGGQFGGGVRTGRDTLRRTGAVLTWLDTVDGRYVLRSGPEWITCTPAGPGVLRTMATELVDTLRG